MSDEKFHLQIPKDNIRSEKYEKRGFGQAYPRSNYYEHAEKLLDRYERLYEGESNKKDFKLTSQIFFQIEVPSDRAIKNEKLKLQNLGINILNYSAENPATGTAYIQKNEFDVLIEKIKVYKESSSHVGRSNISIIEDIHLLSLDSKVDNNISLQSPATVSIAFTIFSTLPHQEKELIVKNLLDEINDISSEAKSRIFGNGICSITCKISASSISSIVNEYTTINEVKLNSTSIIATAMPPLHVLPGSLKIEKPVSGSSICIIDSGVHRHNKIFPGLISKVVTHLPKNCIYPSYDHGTFVASRCIFGDTLDACLSGESLRPYCKIMNVQVFGKLSNGNVQGHEIYDLMGIIEDIVYQNYKTIKVYNLSVGDDSSIKNGLFSDFAKLLDYLTKEYKVLFVVAGGNIRQLQGNYPLPHFSDPLSRINSPAEALLCLTVGSIAKYADLSSLASQDEVSPFSRVGPGADGGIKPELVAHGGNLPTSYKYSPRLGTYGISGDGNGLSVDNGTSFSAPLISRYAQQLFDIYPKSNPNLIKALLCHFAEQRAVHKAITTNHKHYVGFGEPIIESATQAGLNNAAFIYEGKLDQSNYQFVTFHIPDSLAETNKDSKLRVRITLTYDPPVNITNDLEYSKARISASLCKPTATGMKELGISDETTYSIPWNPIIHFEKSFTRGYLTGAWELRLRLYTRGDLHANYKQDYAVTIEILDENKKTSVYNDLIHDYGSIYKKFKMRIAA